jgi:hypothetical protein
MLIYFYVKLYFKRYYFLLSLFKINFYSKFENNILQMSDSISSTVGYAFGGFAGFLVVCVVVGCIRKKMAGEQPQVMVTNMYNQSNG